MKGSSKQSYFLLVLATFFWAGNVVVSKSVSLEVPPVALAFIRWSMALVIVSFFAGSKVKKDMPVIRQYWKILIPLSFFGITCFNTLIYIALRNTTAINSLLLQSFFPVVVAIMAFFFFREKLRPVQIIGILVSLAGTLFLVSKGSLEVLLSASFNAGDLWVFTAIICYAAYTILLRFRPPIHPQSFLVVTFFLGTLMLLPFFLAESIFFEPFYMAGDVVWVVLYLAIFPSILAYQFFNEGVKVAGATVAGLFSHLIPVFGSIMAVMFLGEKFYLYHAVGMVLILGGILLVILRQLVGRQKERIAEKT